MKNFVCYRFGICIAVALIAALSVNAQEKWSIEWTDRDDVNPLELNELGDRSYMPYVLYNEEWPAESRFRVWFDFASINGIGYAQSADGISWTNQVKVSGLNTEGEQIAGRAAVLYEPSWDKPRAIA